MTLRVTFEIVPCGVEEDSYKIGVLDIHNLKYNGLGNCVYGGSIDMFDILDVGDDERNTFEGIEHNRQDGFLTLTRKVLERLEEPRKDDGT